LTFSHLFLRHFYLRLPTASIKWRGTADPTIPLEPAIRVFIFRSLPRNSGLF
jgi:hypothetical protein